MVTGEITCRYIKPVPIGETIYAYGRVDSREDRKRFTSAELVLEDGTVLQRARGIFLETTEVNGSKDADAMFPLEEGDPKEI